MGRSSDANHETKAAFEFPYHEQKDELGCGLACLRMLEEWASGSPARSEDDWKRDTGWAESPGLPLPRMRKALKAIPDLRVVAVPEAQVVAWRVDGSTPEISTFQDSVYLLCTDSYDRNGENIGHWLILRELFDSKDKAKDGTPRAQLAWCADPWGKDGAKSVWTWQSLLETKVTHAFRITRASATR